MLRVCFVLDHYINYERNQSCVSSSCQSNRHLDLLLFLLFLTDLSLFFLMSLAKGLSILLLSEPAFSFIDLWYCFFCFYFIYFCSDLYDFFPSTNFGGFFVLLSLIALGVKLGYLRFFLFLDVCILL